MAALVRPLLGILLLIAFSIALLSAAGCEDTGKAGASVAPVRIKGQTFYLEIAATDEIRVPGLGKRTHIDDDGGMIFVFPNPQLLEFVMRDCLVPIDIIYTDATGRAQMTHAMKVEEPRKPGEGIPGDLQNPLYNNRLKRYSSKFPSQFAIELKGGMIEKLGIKEGDKLEFDFEALKKIAR
jgi:uncharacterized protein